MLLLSYHTVMPSFLDYVFSFGKQVYAQDFHFGGFRQQSRFRDASCGLAIPELGRSGREIQMCYSLRSVEPSASQQDWPWSVRQSAVYHSFDVKTAHATWIIVKGNELLKNRVAAATAPQGRQKAAVYATDEKAFAVAFATHMMVCDWSNENWRWYIGFLEERLQAVSRHTLSKDIVTSKIDPTKSNIDKKDDTSILDGKVPTLERRLTEFSQYKSPKSPPPQPLTQPLPPGMQEFPPSYRDPVGLGSIERPKNFSFDDLQKVQNIEEKAAETLLDLKVNVSALTDLREYYQKLANPNVVSSSIINSCVADILDFETHIRAIEKDLQIHQMRVETLLSLLSHRKSLVIRDRHDVE